MQDGGVNRQFDQSMGGPMGGQRNAVVVIRCLWDGLYGYQTLWVECLGMQDPSRPPGM